MLKLLGNDVGGKWEAVISSFMHHQSDCFQRISNKKANAIGQ